MVIVDELPHPRPHRVEADAGARGGVQEEQFAVKILDGDARGYPYLRGHRQDALHQANQGIDAPLPCQESWILPSVQGEGEMRRSEEHTSELQSRQYLVCRLLLEKKKQ